VRFSSIVVDPPWRTKSGVVTGRSGFGDRKRGAKNRPLPYQTMTVSEICALPVPDISAPAACLFLWVTNGYLLSARDVLEAWGFRYSTTLVWSKAIMGGGLGESFGISTEFILFARRGQPVMRNRIRGTVFAWKRPYRDGHPHHSAKPPESYHLVEHATNGPYVELFSRADQQRLGWIYWGNESVGTALLPEAPHQLEAR
jgi:N6-adenosine-specific RNA methylase IME4